MTTPYTADELLEKVRRGASASAAAATGQADTDLLADADDELRDTLIPLLLGVQEEYYQRTFDQPVLANVASYRINKRAALSRINSVALINSNSTPNTNLVRIEPKRALELAPVPTSGAPYAYYLEGGRVVLFPTPSAAATLRIRAMVRPSRLVLTTDTGVAAITAVSTSPGGTQGADTVTNAAGTAFFSGGLVVWATPLDVVAATPSFEHLLLDTPSQAGSTSLVLVGLSSPVAVGDYLCAPDTTPFVQLPVELQPALVELTVAKFLRARGLGVEAKDHADEAERLVALGIAALTPRVDTAARKLIGGPHFRHRGIGWLRGC